MTGGTALPDGLVRIERKDVPPITVAPLGNPRIDKHLVEVVLAKVMPTAIVLVPKSGHYDWDARELAMASGSTILTVKELYTFMDAADPRPFLDKNVAYNRERLEQHSRVVECHMICEGSMRLRREGSLSDVVVAIEYEYEYEYEFSEEATVRAISRHPDTDIVLNANPNGSATTAAYSHARDAQVPIYKIGELMGALNYDGDQLRNYDPSKRC
ncbi:MAG: hypothetical protein ACRDTO_10905 [Mycobacterium sp.]